MRKWFRCEIKPEPDGDQDVAEVYINDYIGDWIDQQMAEFYGVELAVTAKAFVEELSALPDSVKTIRVRINSPGGDMFAGLTIANALRDQRLAKGRTVETIVDGLAASAASLIFMAGSPAKIADNGILMVHEPWNLAIGNSREMRRNAEILDQFTTGSLIPTYQWHSKMEPDAIRALLEAETWLDADEAIEAGLADEKIEGLRVAASIDPRAAAKLAIPERFAERVRALLAVPAPEADPEPEPKAAAKPSVAPPAAADPAQILSACSAAGLDILFAQTLLNADSTAEEMTARIEAERNRRAQAAQRETDIRAVCRAAKLDDLADGYVASGMDVAAVRTHVATVTARIDDGVVIDSKLRPDAHAAARRPENVIDIAAIYAERNKPRAL